jgi:ornithine cyclodeaminase/alanine dehydrogenase-like protein (mu-crystallin family)
VFLVLTEADVRAVLGTQDLIEGMSAALAAFSAGSVKQPVRTVLEVGAEHAFFGVMPAVLSDPPAVGTKLVTVFGSNTARGLPTHLATIVLLDPETGALIAVMDGRYITEQRTAAVSAVSSQHLARAGAARLAILGSGVQARSHLEALSSVHTLSDVRVWSRQAANRERFAADVRGAFGAFAVTACASAREAVADADLIVLATASPEPVLQADWVAPGTHVMAVGACRPTQREMDPALVAHARLFVDSRAAALVEAGDIVMAIAEKRFTAAHIEGEVGELVRGLVDGRRTVDEITIFKSLGMAVEDVAAARLVYDRARERGLGRTLEI